jgi:hypothetical protein
MSCRRYAKGYLKGGLLNGRKGEFVCQEALQYGRVQIPRTDRIQQENGSLRNIQEPEHRTERMKSLAYVV